MGLGQLPRRGRPTESGSESMFPRITDSLFRIESAALAELVVTFGSELVSVRSVARTVTVHMWWCCI